MTDLYTVRSVIRSSVFLTYLSYISFLILLVVLIVGCLEARLVLVWVGGHQTLYRDQNRFEALRAGPLLPTFTSPCSKFVSFLLPGMFDSSYPRIELRKSQPAFRKRVE